MHFFGYFYLPPLLVLRLIIFQRLVNRGRPSIPTFHGSHCAPLLTLGVFLARVNTANCVEDFRKVLASWLLSPRTTVHIYASEDGIGSKGDELLNRISSSFPHHKVFFEALLRAE
jgi:hypothetical protein